LLKIMWPYHSMEQPPTSAQFAQCVTSHRGTDLYRLCALPKLVSLILGQIISCLITGTAIFSSLLAQEGIDLPTTQSSLNYILLCMHLVWAFPKIRQSGLAVPKWQYALWALADVEANYFVVWAYQYTSITSVMLLDCFAIPSAMLLSHHILRASYSRWHVLGCFICVSGLVLTVISDVIHGNSGSPVQVQGQAWIGDLMVLFGAMLYGLSNVLQEKILKKSGRRCEALGMLGICGSVISGLQAALVEREALMQCTWTRSILVYMLGFQFCLWSMYSFTSILLQVADATVFNLSVLTSDVYSVLFAWIVQHRRPTWMYGVAFPMTLCGVVVYNLQPPVAERNCASEALQVPSTCQDSQLRC